MIVATTSLPTTAATPLRAMLPLLVAGAVYAVLLMAGDQLLRDPDTYWHIAAGNWIIDHRAVPRTDVFSWTMYGAPWTSTHWLSQVSFATAHRLLGWTGPVILAGLAAAAAFGLFARAVGRWLSPIATLALTAAAFSISAGHLLARPHLLALPAMVAFVGGLVATLDRRTLPSWWLLGLMTLWTNLHGGFVLGLALIGPVALGAIWQTPNEARPRAVVHWASFGLLAIAAACVTPYGYECILASQRILSLGKALPLIGEWRAADFGQAGALEIAVLGGFALALWCGFKLSAIRVVLVVGFVFMALSHVRNAEVFALLTPLVLARPLAEQTGSPEMALGKIGRTSAIRFAVMFLAVTVVAVSAYSYVPDTSTSPVAAARIVKERGLTRVLNDYDFGGYLIFAGVPTYIDGRADIFGETAMMAHNSFSGAQNPDDFFRLISDPRVEATLLRTQSAATKLLDRLDGWTRIYADDLAVVHLRDANAKAATQPRLRSSLD